MAENKEVKVEKTERQKHVARKMKAINQMKNPRKAKIAAERVLNCK